MALTNMQKLQRNKLQTSCSYKHNLEHHNLNSHFESWLVVVELEFLEESWCLEES